VNDLMRGSILLLCLVFMAALSVSALTAMRSAWSSQLMVSAYLTHHQVLISVEQAIEQAEADIWQHWNSSLSLPVEYAASDPASTIITLQELASPGQFPAAGECLSLFALSGHTSTQRSEEISGRASIHVYWDICCDLESGCASASSYSANTFRRVRYWSRHGFNN
jgi:hypothetical protein